MDESRVNPAHPPDSPGTEEDVTTTPPKYKTLVVLWLAIYPAVLVGLATMKPLVADIPLPFQALALTVFVLPLAVWVLIPLMQRLFRSWLYG